MVKDKLKGHDKKNKSKYQLKIQRRRRLAASLNVSDRPYPALWAIIDEREENEN